MNNLVNKVSVKTVRIVAVLWVIFIALSVVYCMGKVKSEVGMEVFDLMSTGYSYEYANEFINNASSSTTDFYRNVQIPIDYFLALFLGLFPITCYLYMKKKINISNFFIFIALAISVLDGIENTLIFNILGGSLNESIVSTASLVTVLKNICMLTTYVTLIVFTIKYKKIKR